VMSVFVDQPHKHHIQALERCYALLSGRPNFDPSG
jgi:hypothetical protein